MKTIGLLGMGIWFAALPSGHATCVELPGDLNGSGDVTIVDIQCAILVSLWSLTEVGDVPACVVVPITDADVDCSGDINIVDVTVVIPAVLGSPLATTLDQDANGCVDVCQQDDGVCAAFECSAYPWDCCKPDVECSSDPCALSAACDGTPSCGGNPCPSGDGAACDDGDVCTVGEICGGGICGGGVAKACNDNDGCTTDECAPDVGCVFSAIAGCICKNPFGPEPSDCCLIHPTPNCQAKACATCVCDIDPFCCETSWDLSCVSATKTDCLFQCGCGLSKAGSCCTEHPLPLCNDLFCMSCVCDKNPACCETSWTQDCAVLATTASECANDCTCETEVPPTTPASVELCHIVGTAGQIVNCPFQLTRGYQYDPPPTSLQTNIAFDAKRLKLVGFYDWVCFGKDGTPPCFEVPVAGSGSFPLSTGHSITLSPSGLSAWQGWGGLVIVNVSKPKATLTTAWLDFCGFLHEDPKIFDVRFQVLSDIKTSGGVVVELSNFLVVSGWDMFGLKAWPEKNLLVMVEKSY